jgi:hypothetical protein
VPCWGPWCEWRRRPPAARLPRTRWRERCRPQRRRERLQAARGLPCVLPLARGRQPRSPLPPPSPRKSYQRERERGRLPPPAPARRRRYADTFVDVPAVGRRPRLALNLTEAVAPLLSAACTAEEAELKHRWGRGTRLWGPTLCPRAWCPPGGRRRQTSCCCCELVPLRPPPAAGGCARAGARGQRNTPGQVAGRRGRASAWPPRTANCPSNPPPSSQVHPELLPVAQGHPGRGPAGQQQQRRQQQWHRQQQLRAPAPGSGGGPTAWPGPGRRRGPRRQGPAGGDAGGPHGGHAADGVSPV